jgi:hypothetical protein
MNGRFNFRTIILHSLTSVFHKYPVVDFGFVSMFVTAYKQANRCQFLVLYFNLLFRSCFLKKTYVVIKLSLTIYFTTFFSFLCSITIAHYINIAEMNRATNVCQRKLNKVCDRSGNIINVLKKIIKMSKFF